MKKKLRLIRGLPGSFKSTLAAELGPFIEADEFWVVPTEEDWYRWDSRFVKNAHEWCFALVIKYLFVHRFDEITVSNTFTTVREMRRYLQLCLDYDIELEILEPDNPDRYDIQLCFERNIHNVPLEAISAMRKRWVDLPTGKWTRKMIKDVL